MSPFVRKHEFTRSARLGPSADIQSIGNSLQSQRVWTVEGAETKWLTLCLQDLRIRSCFLCLGNGPENSPLAEILVFSSKYQSIEILVTLQYCDLGMRYPFYQIFRKSLKITRTNTMTCEYNHFLPCLPTTSVSHP